MSICWALCETLDMLEGSFFFIPHLLSKGNVREYVKLHVIIDGEWSTLECISYREYWFHVLHTGEMLCVCVLGLGVGWFGGSRKNNNTY